MVLLNFFCIILQNRIFINDIFNFTVKKNKLDDVR